MSMTKSTGHAPNRLDAPLLQEDQVDNIVMQTEKEVKKERKADLYVFFLFFFTSVDRRLINVLVKINRCIHGKKFIIYSVHLT